MARSDKGSVVRSRSGERGAAAGAMASPAASPADVARYVAGLTAELSTIARGAHLDLLAYFLDIARMEAIEAARAHKPRQD